MKASTREHSIESNEAFSVATDSENQSFLLKTIKLPKNLKMLTNRLPRATYGDSIDVIDTYRKSEIAKKQQFSIHESRSVLTKQMNS